MTNRRFAAVPSCCNHAFSTPIAGSPAEMVAASYFPNASLHSFSCSETPLSAVQAEQFIDAIAAVARTPRGTIDLSTVKPEALFAQGGTVLSEPQLAAFKQPELRRRQLAANPTL